MITSLSLFLFPRQRSKDHEEHSSNRYTTEDGQRGCRGQRTGKSAFSPRNDFLNREDLKSKNFNRQAYVEGRNWSE